MYLKGSGRGPSEVILASISNERGKHENFIQTVSKYDSFFS